MPTMDRRAGLLTILDNLVALAPESNRDRLRALRARLEAERIRILVAGEAKRGKSTVINAFIGRDLLPTGVTPVTAVATTLRYGTPERLEAAYVDGRVEQRPLGGLAELVTECGNPGNRLGVAEVTAFLEADRLAGGLELVDTPGTGSVYEHNTAEALRAFESMDAAIFVLTADPPISSAERALLRQVAGRSVTTFILLNKLDRLSEEERSEAVVFTREHVRDLVGAAVEPPVYAVAARAGRRDPGFAAFAADLNGYLTRRRHLDLETSALRHATQITERLLDETHLAQRTARLQAGAAAERVSTFRECLATVATQRQETIAVAEGEHRRSLAELNEAARRSISAFSVRIHREVATTLNGRLHGARPGEIERAGRAYLVDLTRDAVTDWRDRRRDLLDQTLGELDRRLLTSLDEQLAEVREAAAELLDLRLTLPAAPEPLMEDPRFFFTWADNPGQTELLAGAIRRRLPGELGRRHAREHVLAEVGRLVDAQVGRARADLQYRLGETVRRMIRTLDRRHADSLGRLLEAVDTAAADQRRTDAEQRERLRKLRQREEALQAIRAELTPARRIPTAHPH